MAVEDPALRSEERDHAADVLGPARHLGAAAEAEVEAPGGAAVRDLEGLLEAFGAVEEARDAAQRGDGRVVGMEREFEALLLGDGQDRLDEIGVVVPHLVFGDRGLVGSAQGHGGAVAERGGEVVPQRVEIGGGVDRGHVEFGAGGAAPARRGALGAPDGIGHEVVAEDRHAGAGDGADDGLVVLDLGVAAGQAEHGLVVEMHRHVLDGVEREAGLAGLLDQRADVGLLPALLAGQLRRVHLDAVRADLAGETQLLVGQLVELADGDPEWHGFGFLPVSVRRGPWRRRIPRRAISARSRAGRRAAGGRGGSPDRPRRAR